MLKVLLLSLLLFVGCGVTEKTKPYWCSKHDEGISLGAIGECKLCHSETPSISFMFCDKCSADWYICQYCSAPMVD